MGWFDDAKKKVAEAKHKATATAKERAVEAQTEAARRAAGAVLAEAGRRVGDFLEGFVSSAEDALEEARAERGLGPDDDPEVELEAPAEPEPEPEPELVRGPSAAERALEELRRLKSEKASAPAPEPEAVLEPDPEPADPFAAARAALERSAAARVGASVNKRAQAREDAARAELARLKGLATEDD